MPLTPFTNTSCSALHYCLVNIQHILIIKQLPDTVSEYWQHSSNARNADVQGEISKNNFKCII